MMMRLCTYLFAGIFLFWTASVCPASQNSFAHWLEKFKTEARTRGISEQTLTAALKNVKPLPWVIELDRAQPEFRISLERYLRERVTRKRIETGRKLLQKHQQLLKQIEAEYGVQSQYLVALWAIETSFGRNSGKTPVIPALVTLAFDERRGAYFRKELFDALTIVDKKLIPLKQMKGSWAGAMGYLQFMPSTFILNAVDYDQDGRCRIWTAGGDLFASAANYLRNSGWLPGEGWGFEVKLTERIPTDSFGLKTQRTLMQWQQLGVRPLKGKDLPQADLSASLIQPDENSTRTFLVYENYRTLLKWNRAHSFALAVSMLAEELRRQP